MSADWQNKEAQMRYTAEYMANEYKNEASGWKFKFNKLADALDELVKVMPKEYRRALLEMQANTKTVDSVA